MASVGRSTKWQTSVNLAWICRQPKANYSTSTAPRDIALYCASSARAVQQRCSLTSHTSLTDFICVEGWPPNYSSRAKSGPRKVFFQQWKILRELSWFVKKITYHETTALLQMSDPRPVVQQLLLLSDQKVLSPWCRASNTLAKSLRCVFQQDGLDQTFCVPVWSETSGSVQLQNVTIFTSVDNISSVLTRS